EGRKDGQAAPVAVFLSREAEGWTAPRRPGGHTEPEPLASLPGSSRRGDDGSVDQPLGPQVRLEPPPDDDAS
ncbi:unnamed protein product, partial [Scytosiphon promiscuus]